MQKECMVDKCLGSMYILLMSKSPNNIRLIKELGITKQILFLF